MRLQVVVLGEYGFTVLTRVDVLLLKLGRLAGRVAALQTGPTILKIIYSLTQLSVSLSPS